MWICSCSTFREFLRVYLLVIYCLLLLLWFVVSCVLGVWMLRVGCVLGLCCFKVLWDLSVLVCTLVFGWCVRSLCSLWWVDVQLHVYLFCFKSIECVVI